MKMNKMKMNKSERLLNEIVKELKKLNKTLKRGQEISQKIDELFTFDVLKLQNQASYDAMNGKGKKEEKNE